MNETYSNGFLLLEITRDNEIFAASVKYRHGNACVDRLIEVDGKLIYHELNRIYTKIM